MSYTIPQLISILHALDNLDKSPAGEIHDGQGLQELRSSLRSTAC